MKYLNIHISKIITGSIEPTTITRNIYQTQYNTNSELCQTENETIYVPIPKGTDTGEIIIIPKKGNIYETGNMSDVRVSITVINDTPFIRQGLDLIIHKQLTLKESLCGFRMDLEHLTGTIPLLNKRGSIMPHGFNKDIPKYGIPSKAKFYSEFRKTVLKASLDAIQDQKPEAYKNLKNGFKESYKTTQTYLKRFILHTNDKDKEIKASQVQGVFASGHLPKLKINRLSPKSLGLVDDSVRASWRDDLVAVLSDLTDRGAPTVSKERQRELKRAERELETATKEHESCKGFFKNPVKKDRARKREARAYYRLELNKEMLKKLELIKKFYA